MNPAPVSFAPESSDALAALADFLQSHPNALVLTGAGMSTASGIPDYRDRDGVRRGKTPVQGPEFRKDAAVRRRYWARSMVGYPTLAQAVPNAGHLALAGLQESGRIGALMTQNVDGLHQRAGSRDVLELHGNIHAVDCLECRARFSRAFIQTLLIEANPTLLATHARMQAQPLPDGDADLEPDALATFHIPQCVYCAGVLQPAVIFFGDGVPQACTTRAFQMMHDASALLVIGSSLMVYSGFRFCRMAAEAGKPIAAVNLGKTRADELLSLKVAASAEQLLPDLLDYLN